MFATEITVADLKANPANRFENERIEVTVVLEEGETVEEGVKAARFAIAKARGLVPSKEEIDEAVALSRSIADRTEKKAAELYGRHSI